jgi:hypothetical protein
VTPETSYARLGDLHLAYQVLGEGVIQRADTERFGPPFGRYLAEHIPGSNYVELPGVDSLIWGVPGE